MTQADNSAPPEGGDEQPFISHLVELRDRLLRVVLVVVVIFLGLTPFANWLFSRLAGPLTRHLPEGSSMIAIEVASPFFTPFKLAMVIAIFAAMPYILYQAWAFIAPGLYRHERKRVFPLLVSSTLLFYLGAAFAYFVVFPLVFGFLTKTAPEEPMMGTEEPDPEGAAIASLEPGTLQVLLPGEDVKFSSPADVGSSYEAFQYRTLLGVSASLGCPITWSPATCARPSSTTCGTAQARRHACARESAANAFSRKEAEPAPCSSMSATSGAAAAGASRVSTRPGAAGD